MLINPQTGQKIRHDDKPHQLQNYLMLDSGGTGLFHAKFHPEHLGEHEHRPHQITVLFDQTSVTTLWQSDSGRSYQKLVGSGQCYFVPSQQPHGLIVEQTSELISFYLTPSFITEVLPESHRGQPLNLESVCISEDALVQQLAATVRLDWSLNGSINQLLVESVINVIVFHLAHRYAPTSIEIKPPANLPALHLANVKEFIAVESSNNITIADMAKLTGYSAVHFSRMFKRATGQSPYQYLTHYRVTHAKTLLRSTHLSITEVAHQVGFSSHAHFSTQFRRVTGTSPQAYRAQILKE